jgi:fermentation-respiration switch protein FrsA (DUF1100 family)
VEFAGEGGTPLFGDLWIPDGSGTFGCVIFTQAATRGGTGATFKLADILVKAGIASLVYTVRNWEESLHGVPFDQDPQKEIRDHRHAITFVSDQPEIDPERIGYFGTSVRGGEAIILAATDRRISCVVAQVPMMSGLEQARNRFSADALARRRREFAEDRLNVLHGHPPAVLRTSRADLDDHRPAMLETEAYIEFNRRNAELGIPMPEHYTLRSQEYLFELEPRAYLPLISPTPLLMIVADDDREVGTASQLRGYEETLEPKRLVLTKGGHFDVHFGEQFDQISAATTEWLVQWLGAPK